MDIVEDVDEKNYNNNGKPCKSSRIFACESKFLHFFLKYFFHFFIFSCFSIFHFVHFSFFFSFSFFLFFLFHFFFFSVFSFIHFFRFSHCYHGDWFILVSSVLNSYFGSRTRDSRMLQTTLFVSWIVLAFDGLREVSELVVWTKATGAEVPTGSVPRPLRNNA